jgi:hypothetical protein
MVIDQTDLAKDLSDADATYNDWLSAGNFEPETVSFDQPFIHHNALYRVDGLTDEKGFLDWTQRAAARPDLALTGRVINKKKRRGSGECCVNQPLSHSAGRYDPL